MKKGDFVDYKIPNQKKFNNEPDFVRSKITESNDKYYKIESTTLIENEFKTWKIPINNFRIKTQEIWTTEKYLEKAGFIKEDNCYIFDNKKIFLPFHQTISKSQDKGEFIINAIGGGLFVAKHKLNENYYKEYIVNNFLDFTKFRKDHIEVTMLNSLIDYFESQNIEYNKDDLMNYIEKEDVNNS